MEQLKQPKSRFLFRLLDWLVVRKFVINHLRKRGIPTYLWVLNEKEDFERAFAMGAAGVMTDRPTLLREFLEENPHVGSWGTEKNLAQGSHCDKENTSLPFFKSVRGWVGNERESIYAQKNIYISELRSRSRPHLLFHIRKYVTPRCIAVLEAGF